MNLLKRTWAAGARPIGAPGCPEFAAKVASTFECHTQTLEYGGNCMLKLRREKKP